MADSSNVVKIALLAGGGFLLYRLMSGSGGLFSTASLASAVSSSGSTPPATTDKTAPPAALPVLAVQDLLAAAGKTATDLLTSDQWNFYRNQLRPPDLTPAQLSSAVPAGAAPMTAADFVAKLHAVGLGAVRIPVPTVVNLGGRQVVVWSSRPGGRSPSSPRPLGFPRGPF